MTKRIAAGFRYGFYGVVNSSGYCVGSTAAGPSAGGVSHMLRLDGVQTMPIEAAENEDVVVLGDDQPLTTFGFEAAGLPNGILELAVRDSTFDALCQGTLVQTIGDLEMSVYQPADRASIDMALLLQRRSKKWEPGVLGVKAWEIVHIPRSTLTPLFAALRQRESSPYRYSMNTSKADRMGWGATLVESVNGTTAAPFTVVDSDNPIHLTAGLGNAAAVAFSLNYTPVSGAKVKVFKNGVLQVLTTHYTVAGKVVTFVTAPATDAQLQFLYEVAEGDLS